MEIDMARAELKDEAAGDSSSLIFPQDMEKDFYPEAIKFSVYERAGVSYNEVRTSIKGLYNIGEGFLKAGSARVQSKDQIEQLTNEINKTSIPDKEGIERKNAIKARANLETSKLAAEGRLKDADAQLKSGGESVVDFGRDLGSRLSTLKKDNTLENTKTRHLKSIYLAMPESLNFAEGVDWQGTDLGVIGGLKAGAFDKDNALDYGVLTGAGAALGGAGGLAASLIPGISGLAGTIVGAVLGGSGLQSGIESAFSVKTNPFKEQTFQGVGFRPFDFSFTFRPRSESDVNVVQNIIQTFRAYSKPTFKDAAGTIFKYPKEFLIEFLTIGVDNSYETNTYIPQIKFCVCTAVNTNFTGTGWRSFKGGAPTEITLQLTFSETEIITGEDVFGQTRVGRFAVPAGEGGNF